MKQIVDIYERHINPQYSEFLARNGLDRLVASAEGAEITGADGRRFIDFVAGFGVHNLGHNPPRVVKALQSCLEEKPLWNKPFVNPVLAQAVDALCRLTGRAEDRVFLCSTGAEGIDTAIKLARLATGRKKIVAAHGSFHGYTLGALSVSGIPSQRKPFEPLLTGVEWVPFGEEDALAETVDADTAAVLLEPVQAEIGAIDPPPGYLGAAQDIARRAGALFVADEVRTGLGRTGPLLACDREAVDPDIVVIGKSLGSGIVPVSAVLSRPDLHQRADLSFAMSASSFAGNRLAATAALATLECFRDSDALRIGAARAQTLRDELGTLAEDFPGLVTKVTGRGLLVGIHFSSFRSAQRLVRLAMDDGLLVALAFCNNRCVLLEPPLTISENELRRGIGALKRAVEELR